MKLLILVTVLIKSLEAGDLRDYFDTGSPHSAIREMLRCNRDKVMNSLTLIWGALVESALSFLALVESTLSFLDQPKTL